MSRALLDFVVSSSVKKNVPVLKPGATVKVYQKIKEGGKERVQMFQGLVIRVSAGASVDKTFTVRKMVQGVGVEKIFPFHTPTVEKIEVVKQGKVRRAKLYYMRDLQGKSTRLRETDLALAIMDEAAPVVEEETPVVEEAVQEEAAAPEAEAAPEVEAAAPEEETPTEDEEK
ncbi:MAG: 50S ribosomal protein L19 [Candidatus Gracilibacteria bacterium]|jgi:large subunit ribosomal protein L19